METDADYENHASIKGTIVDVKGQGFGPIFIENLQGDLDSRIYSDSFESFFSLMGYIHRQPGFNKLDLHYYCYLSVICSMILGFLGGLKKHWYRSYHQKMKIVAPWILLISCRFLEVEQRAHFLLHY
jgi:hypothetical protein